MQSLARSFVLSAALLCGALFSPAGLAQEEQETVMLEHSPPSTAEMVLDLTLARPLMLAATVAGTALFIVSLPFSLPGGNAGEVANQLVGAPFHSTFLRCLGCTQEDLDWKREQKQQREQERRRERERRRQEEQ